MFSTKLIRINTELHSHKNGLIIVFNKAFGMFFSNEKPFDNSGMGKPLLVSTEAINLEKVSCFPTIWFTKFSCGLIKGIRFIDNKKTTVDIIYP